MKKALITKEAKHKADNSLPRYVMRAHELSRRLPRANCLSDTPGLLQKRNLVNRTVENRDRMELGMKSSRSDSVQWCLPYP